MKNFTCAKIILILSLFLFSSFNTNNNSTCEESSSLEMEEAVVSTVRICKMTAGTPILGGGCAPDSWELVVVSECEAYITGKITATNLHSNPELNVVYPLPEDCPPLYVKANFPVGNFYLGPINDYFVYNGEQHVGLDGINRDLFNVNITVFVDVSNQCDNSSYAEVPMGIALVDQNDEFYPVDDFAEPHEAFSCKIFAETCSQCSENNCGHKDFDPFYMGTACGQCNSISCSSERTSDPKNEVSINIDKTQNEEEKPESQQKFSVQPNPFSDFFTIQNDDPESVKVDIEIFNLEGKRVYHATSKIIDANQSLEISTNFLTQGVYYCKINSPTESVTKKIIKIK